MKYDVSVMSDEELKAAIKVEVAKDHLYSVRQSVKKVQLNSLYGSLGNKYSRWYDLELAESITVSGQLHIQWIADALNKLLNRILKTQNEDYVIASDTDSVVGDSIIRVNDTIKTIEQLFDEVSSDNYIKNDIFNNNFVKKITDGSTSPSINPISGILENKRIKYVMKHRVKKKLFKISVDGKSVVVTEDHSVIVRDKKTNKIMSLIPQKLDAKKHEIIYIIASDTDRITTNAKENNNI